MLHIRLLGNFSLAEGDTPLITLYQPRLQALLACLLLQRQSPLSRHHLAFQFWPDSSEKQAHTNLRKLFFQLQHALPNAERYLVASTQTLGWNPQAPFTLDVAEVQHLLAHLQNEPLDLASLRRVVELYQGELLPGCYDDWIAPLRQQLHQSVLNALERLVTLLESQRSYNAGIEYARRLLAFDPLEEKSYQRLMRLHALDGDYAAGLRVYQDCVAILQRELEVEPDEETQALYQRLRQRDEGLRLKSEAKAPPAENLPLVGRQAEWQCLQAAWRQALGGQSHFVCIWGEAGLGKTRLAEELLDWANQQGILTARTRSYPTEGALAYAAVTTLLRSPTLATRLNRLGATWLSEVARLLPELLEQQPSLSAPQPLSESWQRQRFFEAVARAVLVDDQPLLLFFDDLHWCDQETLTWLSYLLRFAAHKPLLLVGASRIEEVGAGHPLTALRLALRRDSLLTEIDLTPLNLSEVTTLARTLVNQEFSHEQIKQLYADTEGNPLFVVETVRAGQGEGETGGDRQLQTPAPIATLPPKIHAVIRARLAQLSPDAQKIASVAAVIGHSSPFAVLLAATDDGEEALVDRVDELRERRVLREQGVDGYDFCHDRIRDVVYAELSSARRRLLHRRVAEALEGVYAQNRPPIWGQLAVHYEYAQLPARAFTCWLAAAQRAEALDAFLDADTAYERALTFHQSYLAEDQRGLYDLLFARSAMFERQEQWTKFARDIETLLTLATAIGDSHRLAQAQLRQASYQRHIGQPDLALVAGEEALTIYRASGDKVGEIQALRELGFLCWSAQTYGKALHYGREVLQLHRQQGDVAGEASALHNLAEIYRGLDSPRQAITHYEQALQLYWVGQDQRRQVLTLYSLAYAYRQVQESQRALATYQQALTRCQQVGDRQILARVYHAQATLYWELEQAEAALAAMQRAAELCQASGYLPGLAHSLLTLSYMEARLGRRESAQQYLAQAVTPLQRMGDDAGLDEVAKRQQLLASESVALPEPPQHMNWLRTHVVLAEGKVYCEFEAPMRQGGLGNGGDGSSAPQ